MIHRHSPESPTYRANLTEDEKLIELFQSSNARVKSLANSLSGHTNLITRPPLGFFVQNYYVQVGFGTFDKDPKYRNFYLGIDTGSDLTWTQCEGCTKCFFQTDPYFPPTRSTSYKLVPCYQCPSPCQGEDKCRLTRRYGDGATLRAIAATETLHFQSVDNKTVYVTDVFIGCGRAMLNFKEGKLQANIEGNKVSGLLGMGYGDASIWKQKSQLTQRRFSYCLQSPVTATEGKLQMYLRFGDDIVEAPKMKSTPLHQYRIAHNIT
ncbi:Aspartic proteinase nepenthesin-2 [Bienertia sinuspersici]